MSHTLIGRSPDLKRLRDEGYDLEIRSGHLLVRNVPYLDSGREVRYGVLVTTLTLAGDITTTPDNHVAHFIGSYPCHLDGREIDEIRNSGAKTLADGLEVDHTFSAKPNTPFTDYHAKVTQYVAILSAPAQAADANVTPRPFLPIGADEADEDSVFEYLDTASSRAEITLVTDKLAASERVAIVGLGGTGAYVLDLIAKTPVLEIHLFDGDTFLQHNAFRSPGAASIDDLRAKPAKVQYLRGLYSRMHRGIVAHEVYVSDENVGDLEGMSFVFLCLEGAGKEAIITKLEALDIPFVDVGMGIYERDGSLGGVVRVTTSTQLRREHVRGCIPLSGEPANNEYDANIQIADLNALNAAFAVIRWKKLLGFYHDLEHEHRTTYTIDGNMLTNRECLA